VRGARRGKARRATPEWKGRRKKVGKVRRGDLARVAGING